MAILKQRLNRKNSSGTYDTIYLETVATVVKMSESDSTKLSDKISSMDTTIAGKAAASHNHSAANITSGTLAVARGGTGQTSVDTTPTSGSKKMCTSGGIYTALSGKAASSHTHDDRYYTESEVNTKLKAKQDSSSAINTGNIGSQSVNYSNSSNYSNSAGSATYAAASSNYGQVLRNQGLSSSAGTPSANGEIIWQYS